MQSLIRFKGRCRSCKVDGASDREGLKLDHTYAKAWVTGMYGESQLYLSRAAAVTRVEFATSLTQR
jgi:hypothetical protein